MKNVILTLVGAGPGDPELITVKAIKALESADVILYDALANEALLQYCSATSIRRFVGKRFGCHALSQEEINTLIVEYAATHKRIVRLKGGDPFVFGRAQEEMEAAIRAGMEVKIIPGISSALAVPALQMIPLTSRGVAESFWVTTGTTRSGDISNDVRLAARSTATVVILMAMSKLEQIMDIFIAYGKGTTPAAIIQHGSTPQEKMIRGTVRDISYQAQYHNMSNPSIIIIGEVVALQPAQLRQQLLAERLLQNGEG
jgi:uroporphyrin-III C-methyltransferase